jgi:hypothetical protein
MVYSGFCSQYIWCCPRWSAAMPYRGPEVMDLHAQHPQTQCAHRQDVWHHPLTYQRQHALITSRHQTPPRNIVKMFEIILLHAGVNMLSLLADIRLHHVDSFEFAIDSLGIHLHRHCNARAHYYSPPTMTSNATSGVATRARDHVTWWCYRDRKVG